MTQEETTVEGQDKHHRMSFASLSGKQVEATFDGGILTRQPACCRQAAFPLKHLYAKIIHNLASCVP